MTTHRFRIHAPFNSNESFVEVDGKRLEGVTRISFEIAPNNTTILKLEVIGEIVVDGEFRRSAILQVAQANPDK